MVCKWIRRMQAEVDKLWDLALGAILPSSLWDFQLTLAPRKQEP